MIENSSMCEEDSWRRPDEGWFVRDNFAVNRRVNMLQKLLRNGILSLKEDTNMPNIRPISDLRNYTSVLKEVKYGERVYLTRNGVGECAIIDMKELDELDKMIALRGLMKDLDRPARWPKRAPSPPAPFPDSAGSP